LAPDEAFTLVELLIIIVILGILAGMLLPALTISKQRAQAIDCMGHARQLMLALEFYSDDYNGWLPPNPDVAGDHAWVQGDMTNPDEATNAAMLTDPNLAMLASYVSSARIYKCPADQSLHVRSVSMNQAVGTKPDPPLAAVNGPWLDGTGNHIANQPWKTYGHFTDMTAPTPANLWIFVDEDANSINDGAFAVAMILPTRWVDWPATSHNYSSSFAFADGHAEIHHWQDGRTRLANANEVTSARSQPGNADIA
jgi:prepilin-type processing-associated H-X9-DG protein